MHLFSWPSLYFCFLGDWRSTLIPIIAVPVSLIGAFFVMQMFGLSINLITLFALVLAIGIVVDDAIVVVEAVHVKMEEKNLTPYKAASEALGEIGGAIIAITMVMVSVFIPISFMTGPVGVFLQAVLDHHGRFYCYFCSGSAYPDSGTMRHVAEEQSWETKKKITY